MLKDASGDAKILEMLANGKYITTYTGGSVKDLVNEYNRAKANGSASDVIEFINNRNIDKVS